MTEVKKDITWRVYLVYFLVALFGVAIIAKVLYIQIVEGAELKKKVQNFTLVDKTIEAVRGNIYASDGSLLATSVPIYEIRFDPNADAISKEFFYDSVDSLALQMSNLFQDQSMAESMESAII